MIGVTPNVLVGDCTGQMEKENQLSSILEWAQVRSIFCCESYFLFNLKVVFLKMQWNFSLFVRKNHKQIELCNNLTLMRDIFIA